MALYKDDALVPQPWVPSWPAGIRGKAKPKFAFHFQSHKDGLYQPFISKDKNPITFKVDDGPERSETIENKNLENLSPVFHEEFFGENVNLSEIEPVEAEALGNGFVDHSMAEILDGLQDKNIQPRGNSKWVSILLWTVNLLSFTVLFSEFDQVYTAV